MRSSYVSNSREAWQARDSEPPAMPSGFLIFWNVQSFSISGSFHLSQTDQAPPGPRRAGRWPGLSLYPASKRLTPEETPAVRDLRHPSHAIVTPLISAEPSL